MALRRFHVFFRPYPWRRWMILSKANFVEEQVVPRRIET